MGGGLCGTRDSTPTCLSQRPPHVKAAPGSTHITRLRWRGPAGERVTPPRLLLILTENWTMRPPPDVGDLVAFAVEAEQAGIDGVMVSEHIVLGPSANAAGLPANPRDYALPGNQDPGTPWPSPVVLLGAIAAATQRLRLVAGAIISPLRHPLALAKDLA